MGEGPRGSNGACSTLCQISVTPSATHNQFGADSQVGGWACACPRPLWVSLRNSPVSLGVSSAATSTPTGVFTQRFEALFPQAGALGCLVCFAPPPFLLVYLWVNVGPQGLLAAAWPTPFHNLSLHRFASCHLAVSPLRPGCPSLPLLVVWMNVSSSSPWLSDFRTVWFSVSSGCFLFLNCCCPSFGCARRLSVSTYASSWPEASYSFILLYRVIFISHYR